MKTFVSLRSFFMTCSLLGVFSFAASGQQRPILEAPVPDSSGAFNLAVRGDTNSNYTIDTSADLISWWRLSSAVASNGIAIFQYMPQPGAGHRFFRARLDLPLPPANVVVEQEAVPSALTLVTDEQGGSISFTDSQGVSYQLTIPTNAVVDPQVVTMTIVTNLGNFPFAAGSFAAVTCAPDGVELLTPAILEITFPTNKIANDLSTVGFAFGADGQDVRLLPTRVGTNRVTVYLSTLSGIGCTKATPDELQQQARRHIVPGGQSAASVGQIREASLPPDIAAARLFYLARCKPDRARRALAVDSQIRTAWTGFAENMLAQAAILDTRGGLKVDAVYWVGLEPYQDFFSENILPYVTEGLSAGAVNDIVAYWTDLLLYYAEKVWITGDVRHSIDLSGICTGLHNTVLQLQACCGLNPTDPQGADHDLRLVQLNADNLQCPLTPDEINLVKLMCAPPWEGNLNYTATQHRDIVTTNSTGTEVTIDFLDYKIDVHLQPGPGDLKAGTLVDGRHTLEGPLSGTITGTFKYTSTSKNLNCCGEDGCYSTHDEQSAIALKFSGVVQLNWSPIPGDKCASCSVTFSPGQDQPLTNVTIIHNINVNSARKLGDCFKTTDDKQSSGTHNFDFLLTVDSFDPLFLKLLSPPGAQVAATQEGTDTTVNGKYSQSFTGDDGTDYIVDANWSFSAK